MSRIVATYTYTDERGRPVLRKVRKEPKRFSMQAARYRPDLVSWKSERGCVERWQPDWARKAMYNLPVLLDALKFGESVFLCEGERDVDTFSSLTKLAATTNHQGARKFTAEQAEWFMWGRGRSDVVVFIDNDDAGNWAGWQRYSRLIDAGVGRKRIRLYRPRDPAHKDVTDVALVGLSRFAFRRVSPRAVEERADAYGAERAARYTYPPPPQDQRDVREPRPPHRGSTLWEG